MISKISKKAYKKVKNVALNRFQNGSLAIVETEHETEQDSVRSVGTQARTREHTHTHTHTHTHAHTQTHSLFVFLFLVHRKQASFCVYDLP